MPIPGVVASGHVTAAANGGVRFAAVGDKYSRTASGLGGSFSWTMWIKVVVDRNNYSTFISQDDGGSNYYSITTQADGTTLARDCTAAGAVGGVNMTVGTWYYVGSVNDTVTANSDFFGYKAAGGAWTAATVGTGFNAVGPSNTNTLYLGNNGFAGFLNGSICAVKIWSVALTDAELQAEAATYAPVKTSGLWANYKFNAGPQTADDSGNGRTLTQAGTPVLDSSGPPIT